MKKYIAIAALAVASIIITAAALNSAEPQATGLVAEASNEVPYERPSAGAKITKEEEARAKDISDIQPMKRPELFVKTIPGSSGDIVTIVTKEDGGTGIHVRPPVPNPENSAEYQPGVLKKTTTPTETYREFQVLVMTSTNLVNWYPVSYGEKYPETKQPRYFRLWTQIDESQATRERFFKNHPEALANIDEMIARTSGEAQERLKKLRQAVENSK